MVHEANIIEPLGKAAQQARSALASSSHEMRNQALILACAALKAQQVPILEANAKDVATAEENGKNAAFIDRLKLTAERLHAIADALAKIAAMPDPLGQVIAQWERPNGLQIARVRVPLGVIGIIFESRPNVTSDAAGLCIKSGNPVILRPGSESFFSAQAMVSAWHEALREAGLPEAAVQLVPTTNRVAVGQMLTAQGLIDVIVPRGGKSLVARVQRESRLPVFAHLEGICHGYIDAAANPKMAVELALNAKMRRTSICGAMETLLIARPIAPKILPELLQKLGEMGCEIRGDALVQSFSPSVNPATEEDWRTEYLDAVLSVKIVEDVAAATQHIAHYGSHHTEMIVSEDAASIAYFTNQVDSAIVMVNASTQFADGEEFGMGAEIGIGTGRIHARGPIGAEQLTTFKYIATGTGQLRAG